MKPDTARRRDDVWLQKSRSGRGRPETMNMGTINDDSPFIIHHSSFIDGTARHSSRVENMQPFTKHTGLVVPLDRVNVDTDQIVPKQFLKLLTRDGYGQFLFYDWRYLEGGKPNPDFVLNQPRYRGASI